MHLSLASSLAVTPTKRSRSEERHAATAAHNGRLRPRLSTDRVEPAAGSADKLKKA